MKTIGIRMTPIPKLAYGPNRRYWSAANPTKIKRQKINFFMAIKPANDDQH